MRRPRTRSEPSRLWDYYELTKPRIVFLVVVAAAIGYLAGADTTFSWVRLIHLMVGTALAGAGAGALNQAVEHQLDRRMRRTRFRPIPAGRVSPQAGAVFGTALSLGSVLYLWATLNGLTALLATLTIGLYLFVYTPSKKRTPLSTVIGAVPGAMPPLGGWAAATGALSAGAWALFAILFLWQVPHFLAIAWMFREDYAQAGLPMLPVVDPGGGMTARQVVLNTAVLVPISLAPSLMHVTGWLYGFGAFVLGALFFGSSLRLARRKTVLEARRLLLASVVYLPLLLTLLVIDRIPIGL